MLTTSDLSRRNPTRAQATAALLVAWAAATGGRVPGLVRVQR